MIPYRSDMVMLDVLEEHFEELSFLRGLRRSRLRSSSYDLAMLSELDERISGHLAGLVAGGDPSARFAAERLGETDPDEVFAAALTLLSHKGSSDRAVKLVFEALDCLDAQPQIEPEQPLDGLRDAFKWSKSDVIKLKLKGCLDSTKPAVAAVAIEALAFGGSSSARSDRLKALISDSSPWVRTLAWRSISYWDKAAASKIFASGFADAEPGVRSEVWQAACWTRQPELLDRCRKMAAYPAPETYEALQILAILGAHDDLPIVTKAVKTEALGPRRFALAGVFGHPGLMSWLLEHLSAPDPIDAIAASSAFQRITGWRIDSDDRAILNQASSQDDVEAEFYEDGLLPDVNKAKTLWSQNQKVLMSKHRWVRGMDATQLLGNDWLNRLDLESRFDETLRAFYLGAGTANRRDLELFPCRL